MQTSFWSFEHHRLECIIVKMNQNSYDEKFS